MRIRTLRRVGGSLMVALPRDALARLHGEAGDRVLVVPVESGVLLTAYDPAMQRLIERFEHVQRRHRDGLRRLVIDDSDYDDDEFEDGEYEDDGHEDEVDDAER